MFWRRNRHGLARVALAAALIGGEAAGFAASRLAALWPWAVCLSALAVSVSAGWRLPLGRYLIAALAGITLAWRTEAGRIALERRAHRLGTDGLPPAFDLKVEGEVACRRRPRQGGWIVSFVSHAGAVAVKVVAPVRRRRDAPALGETWRCAGWLSLKKAAPSRYARRTLWVMDADHMQRLASARGWSPAAVYRRVSDGLSLHVGTGLGWCPGLAAFNRAMLLGRRAEVPPAKRSAFAAAGTMHVFAISGLHVMLVAGLLKMILSKTGLPPQACAACAIPLLAGFVMLSGARPSAVRAALMAMLWLGAELFGRKPDGLAAWGHAALFIYGTSPALIFDAGCALSFAVMLGIALWLRWSAQFATPLDWMRRIAAREQALGDGRRAAWIMMWQKGGLRLLGWLGISFAAWIASTPIAARVFGSLTLGGLVANVAVVPLAGMAVVLGASGTAASAVAAPLGAFFNNLAALCTWLMERVSETVAGWPWAVCETQPWSGFDCCIWYVAWLALFAVLARHLPPRERIPVRTWPQGGSEHGDGTRK